MEIFFSVIGKIGIVLGAIYAAVKILEYYKANRSNLIATVQLVKYVQKQIPGQEGITKFDDFERMYIISLTNIGDKACSGLRLTIKGGMIARIRPTGRGEELRSLTAGILELGTINAKEKIDIYAWSGWIPPHEWDHNVLLAYDDGLGKVKRIMAVPYPWYFIYNWRWVIVIWSFVVFLAVVESAFVHRVESKSPMLKASEPGASAGTGGAQSTNEATNVHGLHETNAQK